METSKKLCSPEIQTIDSVMAQVNSFKGGNDLFFANYGKPRSRVSAWRTGKIKPTAADLLEFVKTANSVVQCLVEKEDKLKQQRIELEAELLALTSAQH